MVEMFARLKRGSSIPKQGVTGAAGVTDVTSYALKPVQLRQLRPLRVENSKLGKDDFEGVISGVIDLPESVRDAIEERKALCAACVPAIYLDTWARLNHQKPMRIADAEWRRALDNGGRFFDAWAWVSETEWAWTVGELFDVPGAGSAGGLIWRLGGALVEAYGPAHVRLSDGRMILREGIGGENVA
jgi:hypothetical protein